MLHVKITGFSDFPVLRQTPGQQGIWGEYQFHLGEEDRPYDFWVVYGNLTQPVQAICPPERVLLVTGEPPSVDFYPKAFTDQFARIVTSHLRINHPDRHLEQQGLPWHVGRRQAQNQNLAWEQDYDQLKREAAPQKTGLLSVISSNKVFTEGHRIRYDFVMKLKEHFGEDIQVFGRGINEVADKWDAIAPFKYHLALENSAFEDYWTEKLADSYLARAFPIYYGCPNLERYFERESFLSIDLNHPQQAMQQIENLLATDPFEQRRQHIEAARELVLDQYQLFPLVARHLSHLAQRPASPARKLKLKPFLWRQKLGRQWVKRLGGA